MPATIQVRLIMWDLFNDFHHTTWSSFSPKSVLCSCIKALLMCHFGRQHFQHYLVCSESKQSSERCVQARRAVSLWCGDHNDGRKYESQIYDQRVNTEHYVKSICWVAWFWCKNAVLCCKRAEPTLSARGIVFPLKTWEPFCIKLYENVFFFFKQCKNICTV